MNTTAFAQFTTMRETVISFLQTTIRKEWPNRKQLLSRGIIHGSVGAIRYQKRLQKAQKQFELNKCMCLKTSAVKNVQETKPNHWFQGFTAECVVCNSLRYFRKRD